MNLLNSIYNFRCQKYVKRGTRKIHLETLKSALDRPIYHYWNITWFNPPYSKKVKTNMGRIFLNLIKEHFPPHHKFHKLFNKNTVKISYSCTRNIKSIINSHNAKILFPKKSTEQRTCNRLNKVNCPLEQKCLTI